MVLLSHRALLHSQRFLFMVRMIFMTHFSHQSFLCFLHPFLSRPSLHLLRPPTVTQPPPYPLDTTAHFPFGVVRCDGSSPEGSLHMAAFYEPLEIYFFLPSLMPRAVAFLLVYFFFSPSITIASGDKFPSCRMHVLYES